VINYILYHAGCRDGFCAAWVAGRALGRENCEFIPVTHGESYPYMREGSRVYILDFCYKQEELEALSQVMDSVIVLDHHRTAFSLVPGLVSLPGEKPARPVDELERGDWGIMRYSPGAPKDEHGDRVGAVERLRVIVDITKSGGRLAWEFFSDDSEEISQRFVNPKEPPWLVSYTEDRDLWRFNLPDSRAISAFIASHPMDHDLWDSWNRNLDQPAAWLLAVAEGGAILRYQQGVVASLSRFARLVEIGGHRVPCLNAVTLHSELGERLAMMEVLREGWSEEDGQFYAPGAVVGLPLRSACKCNCHTGQVAHFVLCCHADSAAREPAKFGATWFQRGNGQYVYSLRSTADGIDVSEVARKYGGGGHRNAAGFRVSTRGHLEIQGESEG
jgi:hypothetical protein